MIDSLKMQHNYIAFLPSSLKLPPSCWRWYSFLFCSTTDTHFFKNELNGASIIERPDRFLKNIFMFLLWYPIFTFAFMVTCQHGSRLGT